MAEVEAPEAPPVEAPQVEASSVEVPIPEDGIAVVPFGELPFGWVDTAWDIAMVTMPDGQAAAVIILHTPVGQVGVYFAPDALARFGEKAIKVANKAKINLLVASPAALRQLDEVMARGQAAHG